jgi:hypothetical protein
MKKLVLLSVLLLACSLFYGQSPQAFKYQAVIRDTSGTVIADQLVSLRISIIKGTIEGEVVYSEIHNLSSNSLGLVNLAIGSGMVTQGVFSEIPWGEDSYFIKLELDSQGGEDYFYMGTSQLLAVPYALYAETAGNQNVVETYWQEAGNGIYYNQGNVGIGTDNPGSLLHVVGNSNGLSDRRFLQLSNLSTDGYSCSVLSLNAGSGTSSTLLSHHAASYNLYGGKYAQTSLLSNEGLGIYFRTRPTSKFIFESWDGGQYDDPLELMRITGDGKVGIGTPTPEFPLQITGTSVDKTGRTFFSLNNLSTDQYSSVDFRMNSGHGDDWFGIFHNGQDYAIYDIYAKTSIVWNYGNGLILRTNPGGRISFETAVINSDVVIEHMRMTDDGKFGIGILDPQRTLHISDVMRLQPIYSPPDNPSEGDIYMDGNEHMLKVFDGETWHACW